MSERKQFFGLRYEDKTPIYFDELGTQFQTSGVILVGKGGRSLIVFLPGQQVIGEYTFKECNIEEWKSILKRLDDPEYFVLDESGATKAVVRKCQRQIGAGIQWRIFSRDNYTCQYCGKTGIPMTVDHIIPVERDGTDDDDNLITACRKCNKRKGSMMPDEWERFRKK